MDVSIKIQLISLFINYNIVNIVESSLNKTNKFTAKAPASSARESFTR